MDSEKPLIVPSAPPAPPLPSRRTVKLTIAYDGTPFCGWQFQSNGRTVQDEIERALERVTGVRPNLLGCGRTDAGVHALGQVATFRSETAIPARNLAAALNAELPREIRILSALDVPQNFHPIRDALRKKYRYLMTDRRPFPPFWLNRVWQVPKPLDLTPMKSAAAFLLGTHDFRSFQSVGSPRTSTVRTVFSLSVAALETATARETMPETLLTGETPDRASAGLIAVEIEADGFLYNMVRAIAGTLALIGERKRRFESPERMREILAACDRSEAGPTAPACGLYLVEAVYPTENTSKQAPCENR